MRRFVLLVILLLSLVVPVSAQAELNDNIELVSFVSPALNVQGLRPADWLPRDNAEGVFLRASDPFDLTGIIIQTQVAEREDFLASVQTSFGVEEEFEVLETVESNFLTWDIYQFTRIQGSQEIITDMAVAVNEDDGRIYFILMQTVEFFYDNLHEQVFLPAVDWTSPIQFYEDADEQYTVPIPVQWATSSTDEYGIMTNLEGSISVYVDAVESDDPLLAVQDFWLTVNPNFDATFDEEVNNQRVIDDSARIGDLDAVYIIDWADGSGEDGAILQSVARVYEGVIYMTLIVSDIQTIADYENDINIIDNGFRITALSAEAEATEDPSQ